MVVCESVRFKRLIGEIKMNMVNLTTGTKLQLTSIDLFYHQRSSQCHDVCYPGIKPKLQGLTWFGCKRQKQRKRKKREKETEMLSYISCIKHNQLEYNSWTTPMSFIQLYRRCSIQKNVLFSFTRLYIKGLL